MAEQHNRKQELYYRTRGRVANSFLSVAVAIVCTLAPNLGRSDPLTRQQLLEMKSAGIGEKLIIQQIETSGIAFPVDADAMIALRKAGFSDSVLAVLMKSSTSRGVSPNAGAPPDQASELYRSQRYAQAADVLTAKFKRNTATDRDGAVLVLALLKLNKPDDAQAQLNAVAARFPTSPLVPQLNAILAGAEERKRLLAKITNAVSTLKADDVRSAVTSSRLSGSEKQYLLADVAVMTGDFNGAIASLEKGGLSPYAEQERIKAKKMQIQFMAEQYSKASAVVEQHIHSNAAAMVCSGGYPTIMTWFNTQLDIPRYLDAVRQLASISPLSPEVLNFAFHATMVSSPYVTVQRIGDEILAANSQLKIPGVASDRFFWLVIDSKRRRLFTEDDPHPFHPQKADGWTMRVTDVQLDRDDFRANLVPFDLPFDQIKSISQKADAPGGLPLQSEKHTEVLRLSPSGVIPAYALMDYVHCRLGLKAHYSAAYNFAAYVQHVTGVDAKHAALVDPNKGESGSGFAHGLAAVGVALGSAGASQFSQSLAEDDAAKGAASQEYSRITSRGQFDLPIFEGPAFEDLEASLSLTGEPAR